MSFVGKGMLIFYPDISREGMELMSVFNPNGKTCNKIGLCPNL